MRSDATPLETVLEIKKRREAGESLVEIGKSRGTTPEAVGLLLRSRGLTTSLTRTCALFECGKTFVAANARQKDCCRKHRRLREERTNKKLSVGMFPCVVPECTTEVKMLFSGSRPSTKRIRSRGKAGKLYCSHKHCDMMETRRKNHWYTRLLTKGRTCMVPSCKEKIILDEHHIEFSGNHSNKKSKTVWICPTHHMAVHRGYAKIEQGKYIDLVPTILTAIKKKRKIFRNYDYVLFTKGSSWAAAKG